MREVSPDTAGPTLTNERISDVETSENTYHSAWSPGHDDRLSSHHRTGRADHHLESLHLDAGDRPDDYPHAGKREYIQMPGFTPWTFLDPRTFTLELRLEF